MTHDTDYSFDNEDMIGQSLGSIKLLSKIGKGLYLVTHKNLKREEFLKLFWIETEEQKVEAMTRIGHFTSIFSEYFLKPVDCIAQEDLLGVRIKHSKGDRLEQKLKTEREKIDTTDLAKQLAKALKEIDKIEEREEAYHGDIRPENVLVDGSEIRLFNLHIPGCDIIDKKDPYLAPEVKAGGKPSQRADIYSYGAILYKLITGDEFSEGKPLADLNPHKIPKELAYIIRKSLSQDPHDRPSIPDILDVFEPQQEHPFQRFNKATSKYRLPRTEEKIKTSKILKETIILQPKPLKLFKLRLKGIKKDIDIEYIISLENKKFSKYTLGRDPTTDIHVNSGPASRNHAEIVYEKGSLFIHDRDSSNGTYVNEKRINTKKLQEGDEISIGDIKIIFESE